MKTTPEQRAEWQDRCRTGIPATTDWMHIATERIQLLLDDLDAAEAESMWLRALVGAAFMEAALCGGTWLGSRSYRALNGETTRGKP